LATIKRINLILTTQVTTPATEAANTIRGRFGRLRRIFSLREAGVFTALLIMCVYLSIASPVFLSVTNLLNVGRQVSLIGIMATGMTFILITGEVDLSVGSTYALAGLCTGMLIIAGWTLLPAIGAGLIIGGTAGAVNGLLSTYGRLPSFISTLGMLSVTRGVALLITNGQPVTVDAKFGAQPSVLEPFFFIFFIVVAGLGWFLLSYTVFGFKVYAVGGSIKAARVSGINVANTKVIAFVLMGVLAGLAGILSLAFLPSGQAGRTGLGLELDVIAATIVGGTALSGGEGTIPGTILGVLIIGVLRNGLVLVGISPFWQTTIIGAVIILAVGIDKWTRSR